MALILQNATGTLPANMQRLLAASAAANKLGEVAGSGFSSLAQVRLNWQFSAVHVPLLQPGSTGQHSTKPSASPACLLASPARRAAAPT
jgi:hypothetical protein